MSMKSEFEAMNAWEWFAVSIIGFLMAWYMSAGFPPIAIGCALGGIFSAVMMLVRLGK